MNAPLPILWRTDSVFYRYMCHRLWKRKHFSKKSHYKVYYKNKLHSMCPWTWQLCKRKRNLFWHKDWIALMLRIFILSATPCSVSTFVSSKKFTGSRKLFPVMISSIEDLSDGGELEKYYPFNRDSEEVHTPSVCSVYHFIWSSYVTGGWWCFLQREERHGIFN